MKYILAFLFLLFIVLLPAQKQVEYSPEAYKIIMESCQKIQVPKGLNGNLLKAMVVDFPKLMALSPSSLSNKIKGMGQCAVNEGRLKSNELKLINAFFTARENQNIKHAVHILKSFVKLPNKSETMNGICSAIANFATDPEPVDPPAVDPPAEDPPTDDPPVDDDTDDDDDDDIHDDIEDILEAAGAIAGGIIAGEVGAAFGAASGRITAKAHEKIYKALWGSVVAGPNGEDCTPPFFGTFPDMETEY